MDGPPVRPRELTPAALGFRPQPAVRWLSPDVLVAVGARALLTNAVGSFLDKRELEEGLPGKPDTRWADEDELWLDYVADTGDGFDATYSVASLLAQRELAVRDAEQPLQRGDILVLGGDQVYPTATAENYTNRFTGPYRAALPWSVDRHPTLLALPGNHDWYDGLTGFLRLFGQGRWIGGWQTAQTRSYFALQLPHRWWFWGMDILADDYIDGPQLRFFSQALSLTQPGDRLILAVAVPTWVEAGNAPEAHRNLAYVENRLLRPHGVELKLTLAGNLHHYSRYSADGGGGRGRGSHKITSGGGGAFAHPTHDLPRWLTLPETRGATTVLLDSAANDDDESRTYRLAACYPDRLRSRLLASKALLLAVRNPAFMLFAAMVNVGLLWTNQFGLRTLSRREELPSFVTSARETGWRDLAYGLVRNPVTAIVLGALATGLVTMVRTPLWARRRWQARMSRLVLGLLHTLAHVLVVVTVALLSIRVGDSLFDGGWMAATTTALDAVIGGFASATTLGAYLAMTNVLPGLRANGNEAFSAAGIDDYKNFLRLHIDPTGRLTVHAIGVDTVARRWRPDPTNEDPESPWLTPADHPLTPHLVDHVTVE